MAKPGQREESPGQVDPVEYRWAFGAAAAVMAFTCLPYLLCWYATPPGTVYPGVLFNADDHGVYFAWMRQARDGHFFFRNLFTNEPQSERYLHLYFWLLGSLSRFTGLSIPLAFHLGRVASGIAALLLAYRFGAFFTPDRFTRKVIFWTTVCSGGLGWLVMGEKVSPSEPVDNWQPEAFTFQSLYTNGLFTVSLALMLGVVICLLLADLRRQSRNAIGAGACGGLLANIHTYDVITLAAVWAAYLVVTAFIAPRTALGRLRDAGLAALVALPGVLYQLWYYQHELVFQRRVAVPTLSPAFRLYLLGYGLLLPLALYGCWLLWRRAKPRDHPHLLLPAVWTVIGFVVPYLPVAFQRKMVMGLHFPIALLAGLGVAGLTWILYPPGTPKVRRLIATALIALLAITPARFITRDVRMAMEDGVTSTSIHPVWWPESDFAAMNWISAHLPQRAVLLGYPIGMLLVPAVTGRTVYAGHWGETPSFGEKVREVGRFLAGSSPDGGRSFLRERGVDYLLFGRSEQGVAENAKEIGQPGFQPGDHLREVYRNGETVVYEVMR